MTSSGSMALMSEVSRDGPGVKPPLTPNPKSSCRNRSPAQSMFWRQDGDASWCGSSSMVTLIRQQHSCVSLSNGAKADQSPMRPYVRVGSEIGRPNSSHRDHTGGQTGFQVARTRSPTDRGFKVTIRPGPPGRMVTFQARFVHYNGQFRSLLSPAGQARPPLCARGRHV